MAGDALTFRVAFVVRWLLWVVRFVVILYSGVLLFILYFCFSALTDLQKPDDERKNDERNEDE